MLLATDDEEDELVDVITCWWWCFGFNGFSWPLGVVVVMSGGVFVDAGGAGVVVLVVVVEVEVVEVLVVVEVEVVVGGAAANRPVDCMDERTTGVVGPCWASTTGRADALPVVMLESP